MKILKFIGFSSPAKACQQCVHFKNDPGFVEDVYHGLTTMSSGFASVRDRDGFCDKHGLYLSARDSCEGFKG